MTQKIKTFLMFEGRCEEAIASTLRCFPSRRHRIRRYGPEGPGADGSVQQATFTIQGQTFIAIDSPVKHEFTFTPAMSLFVGCTGEPEIDALFANLSEGGKVLMLLAAYPFSRRFGWLSDRFGVSWQLSLVSG